jgi:hypothetical protein
MKLFPKNLLKMKYNLNPILHNRIVLYFIAILALFDLVYFLSLNDIKSFATLILVGILTSFFSKNMIVILVIAMAIVHIIKYGTSAYVSEGLENKEDKKDKEDNDEDEDKEAMTDKKKKPTDDSSEDKIEYADLKSEYEDFQGIQEQIITGMKKIDPLLSRAENFINRFETYKNQQK